MLFDKPISNRSNQWLREMATMETEDYSDADPYTAHLLPPPPPSPSPLALSPTHAAVAAVDAGAVGRDGQEVAALYRASVLARGQVA